jgi:hypothetical protein
MQDQGTSESGEERAARVEMRYLAGVPKQVPSGRVVVHNHVRPARRLGERGFRAWTQLPDESLVVCDCGWALHLTEHYRVHRAEEG